MTSQGSFKYFINFLQEIALLVWYFRFSAGIQRADGSARLWNKCGQMILLKFFKDIPSHILRGIDDPLGLGLPSPAPYQRRSPPTPVNKPRPSVSNPRQQRPGRLIGIIYYFASV